MSIDTSGEEAAEDQASWGVEAGDPMSGVILHVPHASREIPAAERGRILLDDAELEADLDAITDSETDRLARAASAQARPTLCIGTNPHHTPDALVDLARSAWTGSVERDQPFSGCYVPERFYETDDRVQAVMLEIRRDVIDAWVGGDPPADEGSPIVAATAAVIDAMP